MIFGLSALFSGILVAPLVTFGMWKFWDWFEGITGIESLGHSGPAGWCYAATFILYVTAGVAASLLSRKKAPNKAPEPTR